MFVKDKPIFSIEDIHKRYDASYAKLKADVSNYIQSPNLDLLDRAYNFAIEKTYFAGTQIR
jgi:hypothetical protein